MPGLPMITGLPGLPSPAQGAVPSTPDMFSSLLQAAPSFMQGQQQATQIREQRDMEKQRKLDLALKQIEAYAPIALQDPKNPAAGKAISQAYKAAGLDPKLAFKADGSINTDALMQYSPVFKLVTSPTFALMPPEEKKAIFSKFFPGQDFGALANEQFTDPKEAPKLVTALQAATNSGNFDQMTELGKVLSKIPGFEGVGEAAILAGVNRTMTPKLAESLKNTESLIGERNSQIGVNNARIPELNSQTEVNKAQVGRVNSQTDVNNANVQRIAADVQRIHAETGKIIKDTQLAGAKFLQAAHNASISSLGHLVSAAKDNNDGIASLLARRDSLMSTIQKYNSLGGIDPTKPPPADYVAAKQALQGINQQLSTMKRVDIPKMITSVMQKAGLPNTVDITKYETPVQPSQQGKKLPGKLPAGAQPVATDSSGKPVYQVNGHYVYSDMTEYTPQP